jgi:serine/threonine protein kinase
LHGPICLDRSISRKYELVGWLGQGSFGAVLEAIVRSSGEPVAIKTLRAMPRTQPGHTRQQMRQHVAHFQREARHCAALHHPHVVRLLERGEGTEPLYLVFELIRGETLEQRLARAGALPALEAFTLASQLLAALEHAHDLGIVHRDLKPENIMLTGNGATVSVKLLDFGAATSTTDASESEPGFTQTSESVGTPSYAAPEQLRGEGATPASDLYAWGLVLLECWTGQRVLAGTPEQVFHQQFSPLPIPLPPLLAAHPLGSVLRHALAKPLNARARHASELARELSRVGGRHLPTLRRAAPPDGSTPLPPAPTLVLGVPS